MKNKGVPRVRWILSKHALNMLFIPIRDFIRQTSKGVCLSYYRDQIPDIEIYLDNIWRLSRGDHNRFIHILCRTFLHEYLHFLGVRDDREIRWMEEIIHAW